MRISFGTILAASVFMVSCGARDRDAHMTHDFSDVDRWVAAFESPDRAAWQKPEHVVELMEISAGMVAADIGAGTGYFLPYLSAAVGAEGRVLGLDIERSLVDHMNERAEKEGLGNVEAKLIRGDDPGFDEASVDRVLIVNTWHHIPERVAYARKIYSGLKLGGKVFVVDFTLETDKGPDVHHKLPPKNVVETFNEAGFIARVLEEDLPDQYVVEAARVD